MKEWSVLISEEPMEKIPVLFSKSLRFDSTEFLRRDNGRFSNCYLRSQNQFVHRENCIAMHHPPVKFRDALLVWVKVVLLS
jgi:hypothetical protein